MTQNTDSGEAQQLRTRAQIDADYSQLAFMVGDLTAKIPHMEAALSEGKRRMALLLTEQSEPIANQPPEASQPEDLVYETLVKQHEEREDLLDVLLNGKDPS